MHFSQYFHLNRAQAELDFVDIKLEKDQPLFLDPYALQVRADHWASKCTQNIKIFFHLLIDAIRHQDDNEALLLLSCLHEPRETRLGWSSEGFDGNAIGEDLAGEILAALKDSKAVQTGFLTDLADAELFVRNIGHDRISDLTTNLIRRELIEYTQQQCALHEVPMTEVASGDIWDIERGEWQAEYVKLPVVDGEKVLLVPKRIVRWKTLLTPDEYYRKYVLEYLQARELQHPALGLIKIVKSTGRRYVTKKSLQERFPGTKDYLTEFSKENPQVLDAYKIEKAKVEGIATRELDDSFNERAFALALIQQLQSIPPGSDAATRYHHFMKGTLEFLFYPALSHPMIEVEINEGRKRIDIKFINSDRTGFFFLFPNRTRRPAPDIIVECKNYSRDVANPEVDQIAGRFADHRGWLGLLISRRIENFDLLIARCRDVARDRGGYVLPLSDEDVIGMLRLISENRRDQVTGKLDLLMRRLTE